MSSISDQIKKLEKELAELRQKEKHEIPLGHLCYFRDDSEDEWNNGPYPLVSVKESSSSPFKDPSGAQWREVSPFYGLHGINMKKHDRSETCPVEPGSSVIVKLRHRSKPFISNSPELYNWCEITHYSEISLFMEE